MDPLVALGDDRAHAEQPRPLRRPVARRARAVLFAGDHEQRHALRLVFHRGVVNRHLLPVGEMDRDGSLGARGQQVLETHVRERTAHHHLVVAAPRAVRVEVLRLDAPVHEILPGRTGLADGARRRDVVRRDAVSEQAQDPRRPDVRDRRGRGRHPVEVGRPTDIGRVGLPREPVPCGHGKAVPARVPLEDLSVLLVEHRGLDRGADDGVHFFGGRPDIPEIHGLAVLTCAERCLLQVHVDAARERVRDDERRRGEVVGADFLLDAPLEVAVARQHCADDQLPLGDCGGHRLGERSRVADAGRAAVADEVEPQLLEVGHEPRLLQVVGHHLRAGSEARLHPRLRLEPLLDGLLGDEARGDHHRRVRRVGATRDGGNDDRSVMQLAVHALELQVHVRAGRRRGHGRSPTERLAALGLPVVAHVGRRRDGRGRLDQRG